MNKFKHFIKNILPTPVLHFYNKIISRRVIKARYSDWFNINWKKESTGANSKFWLDTYEKSWEHWQQPDLSEIDIKRIRTILPGEANILDAGCGDGYLIKSISKKGLRFSGVDLSVNALKLARKNLGNQPFLVQSFLEYLPFKDNAFDIIVTTHTLEHVKEFEKVVNELKRVASKKLIILVPSQEYVPYSPDYHLHYFPSEEDLLKRVALNNVEIDKYSIPPGMCAYEGDVLLLVATL